MEVSPVMDDEVLVRITYTPEHHDGTEFLPGAVSLDDLKSRGFSVDRQCVTHRATVISRIANQSRKAPLVRQKVLFSELICHSIRAEKSEDGSDVFIVEATPDLEAGNMGHASILSKQQLGPAQLRKVRTTLLKHMNRLIDFEKIGFPIEDNPS
ncbi:hypothetical protein [Pseudomonas syringae]|uniref:hypothetical protein n=1 Tax=Pseudomonas syringae TaxID=317 RepID=UPI00128F2969|nr:hypothetical protein [Pseudomonas syringae]QGG77745.1 hypothetical protein N028_21305 [Pseudomonas syringae USA011]